MHYFAELSEIIVDCEEFESGAIFGRHVKGPLSFVIGRRVAKCWIGRGIVKHGVIANVFPQSHVEAGIVNLHFGVHDRLP